MGTYFTATHKFGALHNLKEVILPANDMATVTTGRKLALAYILKNKVVLVNLD